MKILSAGDSVTVTMH